jgi:hypothetical protein
MTEQSHCVDQIVSAAGENGREITMARGQLTNRFPRPPLKIHCRQPGCWQAHRLRGVAMTQETRLATFIAYPWIMRLVSLEVGLSGDQDFINQERYA